LAVAIGGAFLGAAIGRSSLLLGGATAGAGYYLKNRYVTAAGIGAAVGGFTDQNSARLNGVEGVLEDIGDLGNTNSTAARDRVRRMAANLRARLYLPNRRQNVSGLDGSDDYPFIAGGDGSDDYPFIAGGDGVGSVDDLLADFRDTVSEIAGLGSLANPDDEAELLGELADISEDIIGAIEEEGQLVMDLGAADTADLIETLQDVVDEVDGFDGLSGLDGLFGAIGDIGDIMGWEEWLGEAEQAPMALAPANQQVDMEGVWGLGNIEIAGAEYQADFMQSGPAGIV
jgi:hypothetical protein